METYSNYAPSGFDCPGAFLPDRQDWFVVPVGRNRDSGPVAESNFKAALEMLGGESDDVEVCKFGHWACGWFEIILVQPGTPFAEVGDEIEARLDDYPFLDENDVSNREYEEFLSGWKSYGAGDFRTAIRKTFEITEDETKVLDNIDDEKLREFYMDRAAIPYEPDGESVSIGAARMVERMTDNDYKYLIALASGNLFNDNPNQLELVLE
ncbi:MAG: hypothetical protein WCT04_06240 [Planctomycetota bacterium]